MKRVALWCFLLCGSFVGAFAPSAGATALPAGFTDSLVASVSSPTDLAFTPDGRMLVTTQTGRLLVVSGGVLAPTPALDLSGVICSNVERGVLGVAVDPAFASNHYIYLYYTYKNAGACPTGSATSPANRVSRFTLSDGNLVDPLSEVVLVDNIPQYNGNHDGGDVQFGKDGDLYVTVGDGGCDYLGTGGCGSGNDASRDQNVLLGKVLRITSTGGIPADNPFQGANSARCNTAGRTDPGKVCQETYAWGLRNPFRIAFDPNAAGTSFYINDVGQSTWEEIDVGQAGADYGWNVREGPCATDSTTNCGPPPAGMTNPIFAYGHAAGCDALTGGAFVPTGIWPAAYDDAYIFSDYICGNMYQLVPAGGGSFTDTPFATGLGADSAVSMLFGPYNGSKALYYTTYAAGGSVRAIAYTAPFNRAPTAALSASPTSGPAPLTVSLDGSGSSDPDAGDTLTYVWSFGDGSATLETTSAQTSHVYSAAGTYYASLTVRDSHGAVSAPVSVRIDAGNTPPVPAIQAPAASTRFSVGQTITLQGSASDAQDGALPDSDLSWTVLLHDSTGTHTFLAPTLGNNVSITAPPPASLSETGSYLEIQLTATDSQGLATTVSQSLLPQLVGVTLATAPAGLRLSVNGTAVTGPQTVTSWAGYALTLSASSQTDGAGQSWVFDSWSDGGAAAHTIVTPTAPVTYTASFDGAVSSVPPVSAGLQLWFEAGTESYQNGQSVLLWHDKSGNGRDLSATGSGDAPLYRAAAVNGRAAIEFNGTSSLMKTYNSTFTLSQPTTFFIVYRSLDPDSSSARNYVFDSRNTSIRQALGHNGLGKTTIYANIDLSATGQSYPFPAFQIWSGTFNGTSSTLAKNGQTLATGNAGTGALNGFSIGALSTSNQYGYDYAHIQIAEILYYNTNLTTSDRQALTTWLTQKYTTPATPPATTAVPVVSGTPQDGSSVATTTGSWSGTPPLSYSFQWQRCDALGTPASCAPITGATSSIYTLTAAEVGSTVRAVVTATNTAGSAQAASATTAPIAAAPPLNTGPPLISGTALQGTTLTAAPGAWSGTPPLAYSYQWQRCDAAGSPASCQPISLAATSSYSLTVADVGSTIRVAVTATNSAGSATAPSATTAVVAGAPPTSTSPPVVSGSPTEGSTLTATAGSWSGTAPLVYTYQWQRCNAAGSPSSCTAIAGATTSSYLLVPADVGSTLRVVVTATNGGGAASAPSVTTAAVTARPPVATVAPVVSGTPQDGSSLAATSGSWSGTAPLSYSFQWQRCDALGTPASCAPISGATSPAYTLTPAEVGSTVRAVVTAANTAGSTQAPSATTATITAAPPLSIGPPLISGATLQGTTLTATTGAWTGTPPLTYAYQWQRCDATGSPASCQPISLAATSSYSLTGADVGSTVRVTVTATNNAGAATAPSAATAVVSAAVSSVPPVSAGLQLWFEAGTESYQNGQSVLLWHDKSGNGRDLSATGTADAPLYRTAAVNGRAAIEFNGTSSLMKTYNSTFTLAQPTTFFIVYRSLDPDTANTRNYVFDSRNSSIRQALGHNGTGLVTVYANNNLSATGQPHPFPAFQIWSGTFNGQNSTLAKNGQTLATGNTGTSALNGFSVGALSTSTQYGYDYAHVQIAEILYYNTNLTTTDRQTITTWLSQKYAVP